MTLLTETLHYLCVSDRNIYDIDWIGSDDGLYTVPWEEFAKLADHNYNSGFGHPSVAMDLVIVFKDGTWFSRWEYDGSEDWTFNRTPTKKSHTKPITRLMQEGKGIEHRYNHSCDYYMADYCAMKKKKVR